MAFGFYKVCKEEGEGKEEGVGVKGLVKGLKVWARMV